ncbi:MAG: GNAT family N-acetyltransferase [Candidatus Zixiibacteriota bacterium]
MTNDSTVQIRPANGVDDLAEVRRLFEEYANSIGFSLCFQGFDQELAGLPGKYAPPSGCLFLAECEGKVAGCIALKKLGEGTCEMKRLYVRPGFRGKKIGRLLAERLIVEARSIGYSEMYLDTISSKMAEAVLLYRSLGFVECEPYYHNPQPDALYMRLKLLGR